MTSERAIRAGGGWLRGLRTRGGSEREFGFAVVVDRPDVMQLALLAVESRMGHTKGTQEDAQVLS